MKNKIRSEYIKNVLDEQDALDKKLKEMASTSLKEKLGESINESFRQLLMEADDDENSYDEEEVDDPVATPEENSEEGKEDNPEAESGEDIENTEEDETAIDDIDTPSEESGEETEDDIFKGLEKYKDETGEFDLRGMNGDDVVKVLKAVSTNSDNTIRLFKSDDGTMILSDNETNRQYAINPDAASEDGENEFEIELDGDGETNESCETEGCEDTVNEDTGYTTNYQKQTAMTTPSNNEPANSNETYSMDDGVPTGTEKPYGKGGNNMDPFDEKVNEGDEVEIELDDEPVAEATNVGGFAAQNSTAKSHVPNSDGRSARNQSKGGEYTSTQKPRYTNEHLEKIMKKANTIFEENKELKGIITTLQSQISEAILMNYNMGRVIQLMTENTTNKEEKLNIIHKFDSVRTIDEAKEVYTKMDAELKNPNRMAIVSNAINQQLSESKTQKQSVVETQIYQSEDLNETMSFMDRLDRIK